MVYTKCPRCSLNYIKDTDVLCKICLEEVGKALRGNDDEEDYDMCPECGDHIIKAGEEMCYQCMMEQVKDDVDESTPKEGDWDDNLPNEEGELFEENQEDDGEIEVLELDLDDDADEDDK